MVPITRRRLLGGVVALLASTAGCGESIDTPSTPTDPEPGRGERRVPEHHVLRTPSGDPPVLIPDEDADAGTSTADPRENARKHGLVADAETADGLRFADADGAEAARRFVAETTFDGETLYVEYRSVRECHALELCDVTWSERDIDTQYGSYYRDADVACRPDAEDGVSVLIRIPDALDPDRVTSYGSGWSSSGCERLGPPEDDGTTTDAPDLGPKTTTATETEGDR